MAAQLILTLVVALAVPPGADAADRLTKARARDVAVTASRETCRAMAWCATSRVEPARTCRRLSRRTVWCDVRFLDESGRSSAGLVTVRRARSGRVELGFAVPSQPADGQ